MQTLSSITLLAIILSINQVAAFPQAEEEPSTGLGGFLKSAGKVLDENKGSVTSLLGLEEGKEGDFLTNLLKGFKVDPTIITNLTSSFTGKEGLSTLMDAFKNPEKLQGLLADQTNMDPETIKGFVETIKNKFKPNETSGSAVITSPRSFVFGLFLALFVFRFV
eukprot:GFUD01077607.1.p1 GENE.GFUD01077607.1~~GFUD01077607.1.p1  ORF type:complete len:164 (-),score=52.45 GFUD01077607.1:190-681(-)